MQAIVHQLGELFLQAVPTVLIVLVFYFLLRALFFKPLLGVMAEREARTGVRRQAPRLPAALLAACSALAENAVVLESFEKKIDCTTILTNTGGRTALAPLGVTLVSYIKQSDSDANVTEGNKSLKIVLSGKEKYSPDFQVMLSEEASARIRLATASPDVARYILRYDIVFPPMDNFEYFNSTLQFGDNRDVLISAGGKRTMSVPLDLVTGLPAKGPLTLAFAEDFHSKLPFSNVIIYMDNIRLVDTYAPGAKPVVHVLQSFENKDDPFGGAAFFTEWDNDKPVKRVSFDHYKASNADDPRVTEGRHALQVSTSTPGLWHADFTIPFDKTLLADVLKLDKPQSERPSRKELARYTLRWDVTYPDVPDEWINSTYYTMETFLPIMQTWQNRTANHRRTYSITLDQTEWGTAGETAPLLLFITEGPQKTPNIKVFYDNFRLIDTANVPSERGEGGATPAATGSGGR
jgi:hypothetical protein